MAQLIKANGKRGFNMVWEKCNFQIRHTKKGYLKTISISAVRTKMTITNSWVEALI